MNEKFQHKKSLGQHFLNSDVVPKWMCDAANLKSVDLVLEIGSGTGALTKEILKRGARVIGIEADKRALNELEQNFTAEINSGKLVLIHSDVRNLDLSNLPLLQDHKYKVIANIPYYLSGLLFRLFLENEVQPCDLVFLVQKEVAKRATESTAKGDKESLLSLSVQAYGVPKYVKTVGRGHFVPPPKVDSGIISISDINRDKFKIIPEQFFFRILHLGFGQKRKQLLGNLTKKYNREVLINIFSTMNLPSKVRAEDVSIEQWLILGEKLLSQTPKQPI